jgi:hypothetical protein
MTTLHLRLRSARGADATAVSLRAPGAITAASVQRQPIKVNGPDAKRGPQALLRRPCRTGVELVLRIRGHGVLRANAVLGGQGRSRATVPRALEHGLQEGRAGARVGVGARQ